MRSLGLTLLFATSALAQVPIDMTQAQQERASALYKEVRCPTCVAQAVGDSDALLSQDLKRNIDALIVAGRSDDFILDRVSQTYGDDIRLRPKREGRTALLWAAPWVAIFLGLGLILHRRRKRS